MTQQMKRSEILDKAKEIVNGQREQDYGTPEDNFRLIADLWSVYLGAVGTDLYPEDVAHMMGLCKIARLATGQGTADSYIDLAGYAACGGEIATGRGGKHADHPTVV